MVDHKSQITAHMVVKNEDRFVYFAIKSVLPYVDRFLIFDTGSTDHTVEIISQIASSKIEFRRVAGDSPQDITAARELQLYMTKTPWIWIVDGDEVYPQALAREIVQATSVATNNIVVARRRDLLGDIYHAQDERVGEYSLFGYKGHLLTRLVRKSAFPDLSYMGAYPLEGYYTAGHSLREADPAQVYVTKGYLYHAMYLTRTSGGGSTFNRGKYKFELGARLASSPPEVFLEPRPELVADPTHKYSLLYLLRASIETPLKRIKRKFL
jgi:glycosyltransferase involved in cell wall biosynthesis